MFLVSGGGTGGHLYPAIAIATGCRERWPEDEVLLVGKDTETERRAAEEAGLDFMGLRIDPIRRRLTVRNLFALINLERSTRRVARAMRGRAGVVVGTGGYVSGPATLAARRKRWPLVLHEQNSYPGLVTRTASRWASTICTTFQAAHQYLPEHKCTLTGLPIRRSVIPSPGWRREIQPLTARHPHVLVVGGSQGARTLVESAGPVLRDLASQTPSRCTATLQTGPRNREFVEGPDEQGALHVRAFIDDVAHEYGRADLVICRCGASTLTEISHWQLPAILVPYPHAAGDHQRHNAEVFVRAGAAFMLEESELNSETLLRLVDSVLADTEERCRMAKAMAELAPSNACSSILDAIAQVMSEGGAS